MAETKIYRAGVIPYILDNFGNVEMLFMKPSDPKFGGDKFQVAKGKVDGNESAIEAAWREGREELGLFKGNVSDVQHLGTFLGRTNVFIMKIKDKNMFGDPDFETAETKWMNVDEFSDIGRDLHKPMVKAAYRMILDKLS